MFGRIAGSYDLLNHLLSLNRDRAWRRAAVDRAGVRGPVLDVCSGTGDLAREWAARGPDGGAVVGADFCPEMVQAAVRKDRTEAPGGRVRYVVADTRRLPFGSGRFGAVSAAFGIRNVSDLRGGLREMIRVLRPGGRLVILEFTLPGNPLFRGVYLFYFLLLLPLLGNLLSGSGDNAYGYLPRSVLRFPGRDRLGEILREEGLVEVRVEDLSLGIVNLFVAVRPRGGGGF